MKVEMLNEMRFMEKYGKTKQDIFAEALLMMEAFHGPLNEDSNDDTTQRIRDMIANNEFSEDPYDDFAEDLKQSKYAPFLSKYTPDELRGMRVFRLKDYPIGYALKDIGDGNVDIVGVHNNSEYGPIGDELVRSAINNGGTQLDHYDGFLSGFYQRNGFEPYDRLTWDDEYMDPDWDKEKYGEPDVVLRRLKRNVGE